MKLKIPMRALAKMGGITQFVSSQIVILRRLIDSGLPSSYPTFQSYFFHWHPQFSQYDDKAIEQYKALLASPEWRKAAAKLKRDHRIDFLQEVKDALKEIKERGVGLALASAVITERSRNASLNYCARAYR